MPPRKKAKSSAASTPLGDGHSGTPQASNTLSQNELLNDPWEDEQEIQLLKSMMKWKPTGLHKHFRMISIHNDMTSHGFATEKVPHTRIPGIWKKLDQLYDLETLDVREDEASEKKADDTPDFELPEDEYGEMMWQSRFRDSESSEPSSPPMIPIEDEKAMYVSGMGLLKDLPDGVHSRREESVAESTPPPKKSTRASRSAVKSGKGAKTGVAAKNSKAQSTVSDSEEEEENDEDDGDESSSESEDEEEDSAPTTRRTVRAKPKPAAPRRMRKR
ncbi:CT20-domain-containing protein [Didymella exigua CBS 183.55]|uniref:CT20-domain-containing protein n=1 Tax=Didymella exigua CBS 183.55 TaxID=1150837 RepID=A0A6A5RP87_9PLEO|nr:CT20-domain-containing protein [Didymella exigua CBS 183.55]KAF1930205.1 CT20-domain-containing protein [Didymella exigua CBS 183.55]